MRKIDEDDPSRERSALRSPYYGCLEMKVNRATLSAQGKPQSIDPAPLHSPSISVTSMERRSPVRRGSRGNKHRMSPAVILNIVQVCDLLLLLFSGLLAKTMLTLLGLDSVRSFFLATITASFVAAAFLSRADSVTGSARSVR